jgi:hypothetical protein
MVEMNPPPADAHSCPHEPRISLLEGGVTRIWETIGTMMRDSTVRYETVIRMEGKIDRLLEKQEEQSIRLTDHINKEEPFFGPKSFASVLREKLFGIVATGIAVVAAIYVSRVLSDLSGVVAMVAQKTGGLPQ